MDLIKQAKDAFKNKKIVDILSIFILLAVVLCGIINIFTYGTGIHAYDEADFLENVIWAQASIDDKGIVSKNFYYPYIIPFGSNLLALPFVLVFGYSLLANQCGMLLFYFIYLFAVCYLAKSITDDLKKFNIFVTIISLFIFTYIGNNILHHVLYYGLSFVTFLGALGCLINVLKVKNVKANIIGLALWCVWGSSNGITTFALSNAPLFVGCVLYILFEEKNIKALLNKKYLGILGLIIVSSVVGIAINFVVTRGAYNLGGLEERFTMVSTTEMIQNVIINFLDDYLRCFYVSSSNVYMLSLKGILVLAQLAFAIIILLAVVLLFKYEFKNTNNIDKLVIFASLFVCLVCMAEYVLTLSNERYLFNVVLAMFIVLAVFVIGNNNKIFETSCVLVLLCLVGFFSMKSLYDYKNHRSMYEEKLEIVEVLKQKDVEYGFAKYSNIWNILSDGHIKSIALDEWTNEKEMNNVEVDFYASVPNVEKFFILMPNSRMNMYLEAASSFLELADENIECNDYQIWIFDIKYWNQIKEHEYSIS